MLGFVGDADRRGGLPPACGDGLSELVAEGLMVDVVERGFFHFGLAVFAEDYLVDSFLLLDSAVCAVYVWQVIQDVLDVQRLILFGLPFLLLLFFFVSAVRKPADDAIGPHGSYKRHTVKLNLLQIISIGRLTHLLHQLCLLLYLHQMILIEDARADIVLTFHSVSELPLHEEVVNGDAVIVAIVLHVFFGLLDALVIIWHLE